MDIVGKIHNKCLCWVKKILYKVEYGKKFAADRTLCFRKRFELNITGKGNVVIESGVFFNNDCSINCREKIEIGRDCIFGEGVRIYDHNHRFSDYASKIKNQGYTVKSVHIGENCWIGSNVVILAGAYIEPNSIIGANCVISERITEGMIVTSNRKLQLRRRNRDDGR